MWFAHENRSDCLLDEAFLRFLCSLPTNAGNRCFCCYILIAHNLFAVFRSSFAWFPRFPRTHVELFLCTKANWNRHELILHCCLWIGITLYTYCAVHSLMKWDNVRLWWRCMSHKSAAATETICWIRVRTEKVCWIHLHLWECIVWPRRTYNIFPEPWTRRYSRKSRILGKITLLLFTLSQKGNKWCKTATFGPSS